MIFFFNETATTEIYTLSLHDALPIYYNKVAAVRGCQILFMSKALKRKTQQDANKRLAGKNILLVGETVDFLNDGGVVRFAIRDNRIHIHIKKSAYKRESLEISAQLLRIATVE